MMRIFSLLLIGTILICSFSERDIEEEAYLHLNSSTLLSGETLLFSAFVYSKLTNKPSPLSKILYVELVNDQGKIAHQSKINLDNGRGYGDIFISSNFSSGTYQLLVYTRWMKNFKHYFECPIIIINPFEKLPPENLSNQKEVELMFDINESGIISGLENEIVFSLKYGSDKSEYKGKIVNNLGESVYDFLLKNNALKKINFVPKNTAAHQVILEDHQGKFYFFDFPPIKAQGTIIVLEESEISVVLKPVSTMENFEGNMLVADKNKVILNDAVVKNSTVILSKRTLATGIYTANLLSLAGDTLATRLLYHSNLAQSIDGNRDLGVFRRRDSVYLAEELPKGNYSVSVTKKREDFIAYNMTLKEFNKLYFGLEQFYQLKLNSYSNRLNADINLALLSGRAKKFNKGKNIAELPDYRGELVKGNVNGANSGFIAYSTIGSNQLSVSTINEKGDFTINVQSSVENTDAILSVFENGNYHIRLQEPYLQKRPYFIPPSWSIDSISLNKLVKSSVNSQIENAYFEIKKDSLYLAEDPRESFYVYDYLYLLDDYNRFKTLKETFIEYIPAIGVRKRNGIKYFKVRTGEYTPEFDENALVLLDGIVVNAESILEFSPFKVKSIGIVNKRVYIGPMIFDGLISFQTFDKDMHDFKVDNNYFKFTMNGVQAKKSYTYPDYEKEDLTRIPDRREQLFWNPIINHQKSKLDINFYTSDVIGNYEIRIEGMTLDGMPISINKIFEVK